MTTATAAGLPGPEATADVGGTPAPRPFVIPFETYWRLVGTGAFEKARVFLWKGRLLEKMAPGRPHSIAVSALTNLLGRVTPDGWHTEQEQPVALCGESAPEPDLAVVRGRLRDYPRTPPTARDIALIVEVADSSLEFDTGEVLEAVAAAGVPVYWVVNLPQRRIEVYEGPTGLPDAPSYGRRRDFGPDDEVPVVLDGVEVGKVAVKDVLP